MYKFECRFRNKLQDITKINFIKIRPNWLKYPLSNRNLELDMYNDYHKLAIEYDGLQHYRWPNYYHKTYTEFLNQQKRDRWKDWACEYNNITLIRIPSSRDIKKEFSVLSTELKKHNILSFSHDDIDRFIDLNNFY